VRLEIGARVRRFLVRLFKRTDFVGKSDGLEGAYISLSMLTTALPERTMAICWAAA
jgi:hypothetical protein